jgi:hypothetical protein
MAKLYIIKYAVHNVTLYQERAQSIFDINHATGLPQVNPINLKRFNFKRIK